MSETSIHNQVDSKSEIMVINQSQVEENSIIQESIPIETKLSNISQLTQQTEQEVETLQIQPVEQQLVEEQNNENLQQQEDQGQQDQFQEQQSQQNKDESSIQTFRIQFNPLYGLDKTRKQNIDDYNQRINSYHINQINKAKKQYYESQQQQGQCSEKKQYIKPIKSLVLTLQNPKTVHALEIKRAQNIARREHDSRITNIENPNAIPDKLETIYIKVENQSREIVAVEKKQLKFVNETGQINRNEVIFDQCGRVYCKGEHGVQQEVQIINENGEIETIEIQYLGSENWDKICKNAELNALVECNVNNKRITGISEEYLRIANKAGEIILVKAIKDKNGKFWIQDENCSDFQQETVQVIDQQGLAENIQVNYIKNFVDFEKLSILTSQNSDHKKLLKNFQNSSPMNNLTQKQVQTTTKKKIQNQRAERILAYQQQSNKQQIKHLVKNDEPAPVLVVPALIQDEEKAILQQHQQHLESLESRRLLNQIQREEDLIEQGRKLQRDINLKFIDGKIQKQHIKARRQELVARRAALKRQKKREYELQMQNDMLLSEVREHNAHERQRLAARELVVRLGIHE
ncbi:hypothetical protein SS50377_24296 [Spironucleus salmonicida]|uniref:Uncharacterized protein n=1 Tax=Spironucleus salmonicida TaxID=348837 RepID=V6LMA2_9EUKA|nr:hypothetical protein SS50377_24296 [Spironucleus salmonicida]|eukprot:EST44836.1 Hypothetical protein SS50377_15282 [Spironucleus salmonicida]